MQVRAWLIALSFTFAVVTGVGCGTSPACTTGATQACTCTNGLSGAQTCQADHTFAACVCTGSMDDAGRDAAMDAIGPGDVTLDAIRPDDGSDASDAPGDAIVDGPMDVQPDVPMPTMGGIGSMCSRNGDCDSSLCLAVGRCTQTCSSAGDCPEDWTCSPMPGVGSICQCTPSGAETCDGRDNDCNGFVDDGASCGAPLQCLAGTCACPPSLQCGSRCGLDYAVDPTNCGSCGHACASGASCSSGVCVCPGTRGMDCGGVCRNLASDVANCGSCGAACATGGTCAGGACMCPGTRGTNCSGTCRDLATDAANCGACANACPPGAVCQAGACACPSGTTMCAGMCRDLSTDSANCGACGSACEFATDCMTGRCAYPPPGLVAPLSGSTITSTRPVFRVAPLPGWTSIDGVRVEICRDRACTMVEQTIDAAIGGPLRASAPLAAGVHYWRTYSRAGTQTSPVPSTRVWEFFVGTRNTTVARSWGSVPDLDGNGVAEMAGGGRVYYNGITRFDDLTIPAGSTRFGSSIGSTGDVNGDGYPDLAVGDYDRNKVYSYLGSATGVHLAPDVTITGPGPIGSFGGRIEGVGDVNGDGYADVMIAASPQPLLYLGSFNGLMWVTPRAIPTPTAFGAVSMFSGIGDINGDGYDDIVFWVPGSGLVEFFYGDATAPLSGSGMTYIDRSTSGANFGLAISSAGDVNGDGYLDVLFGSPAERAGYVFYGTATGLDTAAPTRFSGMAGLGVSVTGMGDTNGDGFDDVALGTTAGVAEVHLGSATGATGPVQLSGGTMRFGQPVVGPGDSDGDHFADLIVFDTGTPSLFRGSSTGLPTTSSTYLFFGTAAHR